jgi:hypothetical protein
MDRTEIIAEMKTIQWRHRIPLMDGIITPRIDQLLKEGRTQEFQKLH